jgi:phosphatidylserine/phosphatidylglycerophosphate/cardiolipin synthase-like enzyme
MAKSGGTYNTEEKNTVFCGTLVASSGETTHLSAPLYTPHCPIGEHLPRMPAHHKVMVIDGETALTGSSISPERPSKRRAETIG